MSATEEMDRLVAIELQNFMSIESARVEFDEAGILNLCGYNDSGKSAITRSLEVIFYDAYPQDQVNFIQDDKPNFGIGLEFSSGVSINKYKYADGKSVWEMLNGDQMVYTNRLDQGIAAVSGVPDPIAQYLGVVKDEYTGEELNVRRNTDKLFLINTSGSDNYKILNTVLRCDVLAETVTRMNEDRNKLQSELLQQTTTHETLQNEFNSIVIVDDETLLVVQNGRKNLADKKQRIEYLTSIITHKQYLDEFVVPEELKLVDTDRLTAITGILDLKKVTEIPVYEECPTVDTSRLKELEQIKYLRQSLEGIVHPETPVVELERYKELLNIGTLFNSWVKASNDLSQTIQEHQSVITELQNLSNQHGFKICKNCGTVAV